MCLNKIKSSHANKKWRQLWVFRWSVVRDLVNHCRAIDSWANCNKNRMSPFYDFYLPFSIAESAIILQMLLLLLRILHIYGKCLKAKWFYLGHHRWLITILMFVFVFGTFACSGVECYQYIFATYVLHMLR